jgi:uncharacterized protein YndB with AHSA1/START domain
MAKAASAPSLDCRTVIHAPCGLVLRAFFDPEALSAWWQVRRSIATPRLLGPYVVEWKSTEFQDDLLGRLGGVLRGTVMQYEADRGFFVADAYWLPPDGEPIGPMALTVTCTAVAASDGGAATEVRVIQSGFEESARWRRYYQIVTAGWERALHSLKMLLEK